MEYEKDKKLTLLKWKSELVLKRDLIVVGYYDGYREMDLQLKQEVLASARAWISDINDEENTAIRFFEEMFEKNRPIELNEISLRKEEGYVNIDIQVHVIDIVISQINRWLNLEL
ncbi:hypothetical protein [Terribacillus saccharophilus]|uniref:hypothetical protein n=1 Tax=Terribacillus saccharophilus TaxID=361277 RepID=UPI003D2A1B4E